MMRTPECASAMEFRVDESAHSDSIFGGFSVGCYTIVLIVSKASGAYAERYSRSGDHVTITQSPMMLARVDTYFWFHA